MSSPFANFKKLILFALKTKLLYVIFFSSLIGLCNRLAGQTDPQYLVFQLFTYSANASGIAQPFDSNFIKIEIDSILTAVGNNHGDNKTRIIGFAVGPLSLDHTDAQLRATISQSFKIAEEKNVAVAFSLDDCMFWKNRPDLWNNHANVEWIDWSGTEVAHNYIGWDPISLAPQMCYNSPVLRDSVQRIVRDVIGSEIKKGIDFLNSKNKYQLFAGVISGWETHLSDLRYVGDTTLTDSLNVKPRGELGYNALTNLGYSASNPPQNLDSALERVVNEWTAFWSSKLNEAGIDTNRIYTHVAFPAWPSKAIEDTITKLLTNKLGFQADILGFDQHVMPRTAFNNYSRPGYSTYPTSYRKLFSSTDTIDGLLEQILEELSLQGRAHWASSEGTNINVESGQGTPSDITWDDYLFDMFNHGASLVNIYAWTGGPGKNSTRSSAAIAAYIKFLNGALSEANQLEVKPIFKIFPNPTKNAMTLVLSEEATRPCELQIFDLLGHSIYQVFLTNRIQHIDLGEYPVGMYFLQVHSEAGTAFQKLFIQK